MKLTVLFLAAVVFTTVLFTGCEEDPATPPQNTNPQELITTMRLSLVDTSNSANTANAQFRDIDGPGGNPPVLDTLRLTPGTTYSCTLLLLDESRAPVDTISNEVAEENLAHRIWFTPGGGVSTRMTVVANDEDDGVPPLPIGLATIISVSAGGSALGTYRAVLKHYVPESIKRSDSDGSLGESDVDVVFPIMIQ